MNRTIAILSTILTLLGTRGGSAQEWPQWRGANRDAKVAAFTAPKTWPKELTKQWKVTVGQGDATPALVANKLYVFARQEGSEVTLCLDAANGKELWRQQYDSLDATGPAGRHPGPRSSPAVADGKIVMLGVRSTLSCLDAVTGKKLWRKDEVPGAWPKFFTASSPIITDHLCIAQLGGPGNGAIVAYELSTGIEKWKWTGDGPAYASPVLMTVDGAKAIVTETEKDLVALSVADGKLLWQAPFAAQGMSYNAATPIVEGQTLIYCGQGRGAKAVKIEKQGDSFVAKELWSNPDNSVQFNTPVLKNGLLFGLSQRGNFFCINAKTGQTAWADATGGRGGFGSIIDAGSVLLALTPKAELIVFEPNEKEYKELASLKVAETPTHAYPVVAGNRIFVKDQNSVTLWTID